MLVELIPILGVVWIIIALSVGVNASENGLSPVLWGSITLFTGIFGLVIYAIVLSNKDGNNQEKICPECEASNSPDAEFCSKCASSLADKDIITSSTNAPSEGWVFLRFIALIGIFIAIFAVLVTFMCLLMMIS